MKNLIVKATLLLSFFATAMTSQAQTHAQIKAERLAKAKHLVAVINAHPDSVNAHKDYVFLLGWDDTLLQKNYKVWMQKFHFSATTLLNLGWLAGERPEAKEFFQKALAADSTRALTWHELAIATSIAGDAFKASEYYGKATSLAPRNPDYASAYMYSLKMTDPDQYRSMLGVFDDRFPNTVRGAQSLFWLARSEPDTLKRIKIFERLNAEYQLKNEWSGATELYYLYLQTNPQKAVELANSYNWAPKAVQAKKMIQINQLSAQKQYGLALAVIDSLEKMKDLYEVYTLTYKKAELYDLMGASRTAYDTLMTKMIESPTVQLHNLLLKYGEKIGKHEIDVDTDWWNRLEKNAKMAPVFTSQLFTADKRVSLKDYRGKVVLLTFWFPGCGPCRAEFPHFQNALKKYDRSQVAYLGINTMPEQNANVLTVVEKEMLMFTPLHGSQKAEELFNFKSYPANFLIDKQGRIIFRDFQIGADNEDALELMINQLINAGDNVGRQFIVDSTKMKD